MIHATWSDAGDLQRPAVDIAVVVRRIRVWDEFDGGHALNYELGRKTTQMAVPAVHDTVARPDW